LAAVHEEVALMLDVSTDMKYIGADFGVFGVFGEHVVTPDQILFQFPPFICHLCIYLFILSLRREIAFIVIT